eukprot:gnl/TRDRNA2_/TRDRNA2_81076_c0_seq1.p1 gnl/TRDRNA2_/TRDRNA2_81076_c0~~gnl/TRDRNA2_/TRDRNA2_81076_c0_seq1.p1  ORF type:complete len:750 (+),score=134.33 gnl/TRDRNA2_/TRDRNA2_81076_c0_seq1:225-2252(+)
MQRDDYDGAIADFGEAILLDPSWEVPWSNRASAKIRNGDFKGGIHDCNMSLKIDPAQESVWSARCGAKFSLGDFEGAIEDCNEALHIDARSAVVWHFRGCAKIQTGDYDGGLVDCGMGLRLDPLCADAWAFRARVRLDRFDYTASLADCVEALRLDAFHSDALETRKLAQQMKKSLSSINAEEDDVPDQPPAGGPAAGRKPSNSPLCQSRRALAAAQNQIATGDTLRASKYESENLQHTNLENKENQAQPQMAAREETRPLLEFTDSPVKAPLAAQWKRAFTTPRSREPQVAAREETRPLLEFTDSPVKAPLAAQWKRAFTTPRRVEAELSETQFDLDSPLAQARLSGHFDAAHDGEQPSSRPLGLGGAQSAPTPRQGVGHWLRGAWPLACTERNRRPTRCTTPRLVGERVLSTERLHREITRQSSIESPVRLPWRHAVTGMNAMEHASVRSIANSYVPTKTCSAYILEDCMPVFEEWATGSAAFLPTLVQEADEATRNLLVKGLVAQGEINQTVAIVCYKLELRSRRKQSFADLINFALQAHDPETLRGLQGYLHFLFRGLQSLPLLPEQAFYRGIPKDQLPALKEQYCAGTIAHWSGFTSVSQSREAAQHFAGWGGGILRVVTSSGRHIGHLAASARGEDVLLLPNITVEVIGEPVRGADGNFYFDCREVFSR